MKALSAGDWEDGPAFSNPRHGGKAMAPPPDAEIAGFSVRLFTLSLLSAASWSVVFVLWMPRFLEHGRPRAMVDEAHTWWWTVLLLPAALLMALATVRLYSLARLTFLYDRIALALASASGCLGGAIGILIDVSRLSGSPSDADTPRTGILLFMAGVAVLGFLLSTAWLTFAIARARLRAATVQRLRQDGRKHLGELVSRGRRVPSLTNHLRFRDATIAFGDSTVQVSIAARSNRVPLPGHPVLVFTTSEGEVHVDSDPDRPARFDPRMLKYTAGADGGSG